MKPHAEIVPLFIAVWIALGIAGLWFTYLDKNIPRKTRLLPRFTIGAGILFVLFIFGMTGDWKAMAFAIPAVALITFLNLRQLRICQTCGRTINTGMWFTKAEYCPKCGARLDDKHRTVAAP
jgi:predicted RNA-binding Zn-ribbon protein involved in translation (DUF1610 family)